MSPEEHAQALKEVKADTQENTLAIKELIIIGKQTSKDVAKASKDMDKVAEALNDQNVLRERINYMDGNVKESFDRVHSNNRTIQKDCKANTEALSKLPSPVTARWAGGFLILYLVAFGIYVVKSIHHNENQVTYLKGRIKK